LPGASLTGHSTKKIRKKVKKNLFAGCHHCAAPDKEIIKKEKYLLGASPTRHSAKKIQKNKKNSLQGAR
jgi:hypothetical protein